MKSSPTNYSKILLIIFLANLLLINACKTSETANTDSNKRTQTTNTEAEKSNPPSDNIEELLNIIRLPEVPEEAVWKVERMGKTENRVPGPTDTKITAVLQYTPENSSRIVALIEKNKQPEQVEIGAENWFPAELTAQAQMSGNEMLKGTAYGANDFTNVPYSNGRVIRVEGTDFFILELFAN